MKTSSRERPPQTAARALRRPTPAARSARAPAAYHDAYLDGLFTYCLSIMCEHDQATAALGEALALAERQHARGRRPADLGLLRPWLYALARWACLRRLDARRRDNTPVAPRAVGEDERRRRELAALAWPEAAGTRPEQREALELAVRHQLVAGEVARVLRLPHDAVHALLTSGACEVERTRGALAAVASAGCPAVAALAGEDRLLLLRPGLRRDLVRHVDTCLPCQRAAHRAMAQVTWPGTDPAGLARLTVLAAPRAAVHAARLAVHRARAQYSPRFDRAGFPVNERDRAARRARLRGRAVTMTVVATVVAAPALALWAAWRGAPVAKEAATGGPAVALDDPSQAADDAAHRPHDQGSAGAAGHTAAGGGGGAALLAGESGADSATSEGRARAGRPHRQGDGGSGAGHGGHHGHGGHPARGRPSAPGRLTVDAVSTASGTRITLTASGGAPVTWTASANADWLLLSQWAGTLRPGEQAVVTVTVDEAREPAGPWRARITVDGGHGGARATVAVEGSGTREQGTEPEPADPSPSEEPEEPEEPEAPPSGADDPPPPEDSGAAGSTGPESG